ncbi:MAG: hypothetical protein ABI583_14535 [Betaproteobacteria bacterium]
MKFISIGLVLAALSTGALAQAPLATHGCTKPPLPDASKKLSVAESNAFVRVLETFRNCVQAFAESEKLVAATKQQEAESLKAAALKASAAAAAAAAAADAAVKDYNAYSEQAVKIVTPKDAGDGTKNAAPVEIPAQRPTRGY